MLTKEELTGSWNEIKGKIKDQWGSITDDEWKKCEGNLDQLVGLIQRKTGETRADIEQTLRNLTAQGDSVLRHTADAVQDYASHAADAVRERYGHAEQLVRRRPAESVIVAFGTGLLVGVIVGLVSRSK
jgi:uncharacterized protein YjbJ (UPF0337 family)